MSAVLCRTVASSVSAVSVVSSPTPVPALTLANLVAGAVVAALLAHGLTRLLIRRASRLGLIDIPNHRSSHQRVTARGGGLAFVVATASVLLVVAGSGTTNLPEPAWLAAGAACLGLAVVGLVDDLRSLSQRLRLGCQCLAVALIVLAGLHEGAARVTAAPAALLDTLDPANPLTWLLMAAVTLAGVWWVNLFNFMDGIDGLAVCEALFLLFAYLGLRAIAPGSAGGPGVAGFDLIDWFALVLAAALLGFLPLNWSPARIFMGDAGSLFLGVAIFLLAMHSVTSGRISAWFWPIAAGSFICDASVTLIRRKLTGQNVFSAHRSHLYQRLSRRWSDHRRVALVYSAINILWFLPLALLSQDFPRFGGASVGAASAGGALAGGALAGGALAGGALAGGALAGGALAGVSLVIAAYVPALLILWFAGAGKPDPEPSAATDPEPGGPVSRNPDPSGTASTDKGRARTQRT